MTDKELADWAREQGIPALRDLLSMAAEDWYVEQFLKDETPQGIKSGVVAKIQNDALRTRVLAAFETARRAYAAVQEAGKDE